MGTASRNSRTQPLRRVTVPFFSSARSAYQRPPDGPALDVELEDLEAAPDRFLRVEILVVVKAVAGRVGHPAAVEDRHGPGRHVVQLVPGFLGFAVRSGQNPLLNPERQPSGQDGHEQGRGHGPVEADPAGLHGRQLVGLGQQPERQQGRGQGQDRQPDVDELGHPVGRHRPAAAPSACRARRGCRSARRR